MNSIPSVRISNTESTMDFAKKALLESNQSIVCAFAEKQTAARGRRGRSWIDSVSSEASDSKPVVQSFDSMAEGLSESTDLMPFSVAFRASEVRIPLEWLSISAGCALYDAVEDLYVFLSTVFPELNWTPLESGSVRQQRKNDADADKRQICLKWPNDFIAIHQGKENKVTKMAGLLVEATSSGGKLETATLGLGFNLFEAPDVEMAVSLIDELFMAGNQASPQTLKKFNKWKSDKETRQMVVSRFLESFERELLEYITIPRTIGQLRSLAISRMTPLGTMMTVAEKASAAEFVGLGDDGCLLLGESEEKHYSADTSIRLTESSPGFGASRGDLGLGQEKAPSKEKAEKAAEGKKAETAGKPQSASQATPKLLDLYIDMGNTRLHWGFGGGAGIDNGHIVYDDLPKEDEISSRTVAQLLEGHEDIRELLSRVSTF